jgi:hypothetical protein
MRTKFVIKDPFKIIQISEERSLYNGSMKIGHVD